ncbi:hypothetical protein NEFER03_0079 [Nematocida sp. LUAm3]|nr:hypothetical protein NEFER03_0079 [Nematocida sp. LUAm3]KAI5173532.1 hypothetical protein NEFER02_0048 [Nematocida sp. LUAm2]KAI5176753.1 hypothetical protein NEFER01_0078 [Nematocida sp. LUAm1]
MEPEESLKRKNEWVPCISESRVRGRPCSSTEAQEEAQWKRQLERHIKQVERRILQEEVPRTCAHRIDRSLYEASEKKEKEYKEREEGKDIVMESEQRSSGVNSVRKQVSIQRIHRAFYPSIYITKCLLVKEFEAVDIPLAERCIEVHLPGRAVEVKISYSTTATDVISYICRLLREEHGTRDTVKGTVKGTGTREGTREEGTGSERDNGTGSKMRVYDGNDEKSMVLSLHTYKEKKVLKPLDRPIMEIIQWKLNNSLLNVVNGKIIPQKKLLQSCGFFLKVERKHLGMCRFTCSRYLLLRHPGSYKLLRYEESCGGPRKESKEIFFLLGAVKLLIIDFFFFLSIIFGKRSSLGNRSNLIIKKTSKENEPCDASCVGDQSFSLNLSNSGLTEVPSCIFSLSNLKELNISNNRIEVLPERLNLLNLDSLDASNNCIVQIEAPLHIPVLNLQNNHLIEFHSKYPYERLNLLDNPLKSFRAHTEILHIREILYMKRMHGVFSGIKRLSIVDVELRKFIGTFPLLEHLQLINNNLIEISILAPNLKSVLCSHNSLTDFPFIEHKKYPQAFSCLTSLSLPYNSLNLIPNRVWALPLSYLNLSYNQIVRVDPSVKQGTLLHLNVSGNQIKEVYNISKLYNLVCLIGSFNMLESIQGLDALSSLQMVSLSYNMFKGIPRISREPNEESGRRSFCLLNLIGNKHLSISSNRKEKLKKKGIIVLNKEEENIFITIKGNIKKTFTCRYCGVYVPKEKYKEKKEEKEMKSCSKAELIQRELVASVSPKQTRQPANFHIYAYFYSKSPLLKNSIEKALLKIERLIAGDTEDSLIEKWEEYRDKMFQIIITIRDHIFPSKIDILSFVILTEMHFMIIGSDFLRGILVRNERGIYLKQGDEFEMILGRKNPKDESIILLHKAIIRNISVRDLISVYKRNRSFTETKAFLSSHELRSTTALICPLHAKQIKLTRKEQEKEAPKFLESLSMYSLFSHFVKVPVVVFTDIASSTKFWSIDPIKMHEVSKMHNLAIRELLYRTGGYEVKTEGDAFMMIFYDENSAMDFGSEIHRMLLEKNWLEMAIENNPLMYYKRRPIYRGIQIRVGMSKGACIIENDPVTKRLDFYGKAVIEAARLCSIASAGETFISQSMYNRVKDTKPRAYIVIPRGRAILAGLEQETHHVYEVLHKKLRHRLLLQSALGKKRLSWLVSSP